MYISVAVAHAVCAAVRSHGVALEALYEDSAVGPELVAEPSALLPLPDFERLIKAAYRLTGAPDLGLRVAELAPLGMLHVVGHLMASCTTLRATFDVFRRFLPIVDQDASYSVVEHGDSASFVFTPTTRDPDVRRFRAELCLGFTVRVARQLLAAPQPPDEVRFEHAPVPYLAQVQRLFECPVRFEADTNAVVFPGMILDAPLLVVTSDLAEVLRLRAEQLLARRAEEDDLPRRLFLMLRDEASLDDVSAVAMSRRLALTARTLRRRLATRGLTFSSILDDVRRERALEELALPTTEVKELCERLGFSEPSAFHRAFKRWTGTTIGEYRRRSAERPATDADR